MKVVSKQTNSRMCIICGIENPLGLKANFYNMENGTVGAIFTFKKEHQSYPERVHGGMICALLDELAGRAVWVTNPELLGVTATLNLKYRKPVPYDEELFGTGEILSRNGRIFVAKSKILDKQKQILAEAEGTYVIMPNDHIAHNHHIGLNDVLIDSPDNVTEIDL
jgi:uncharacterized protein (TIGR00369 family)